MAAESLQVRIAWGGGEERLWQGTIGVSEGAVSQPQPLGIEADEPGSMWIDGGRLIVRQRSPRAYDGVDVTVTAPRDAKLIVQLASQDSNRKPTIEVPLSELSGEFRNVDLDDHENRLLVRRTPGDMLQVIPKRPSMVFSPGETLRMDLVPRLLPVPADSKIRVKVELTASRESRELWSSQYDALSGQAQPIPLEIKLPEHEGVYEVTITAATALSWSHPVRQALPWKRPLAERRVQLLVLGPQRAAGPSGGELSPLTEIDPTSPRWWEKVKLPRLSRASKGPLGNGCLQPIRHALGEMAQLKPSTAADVSWEAYWLSVATPGRPHVLEVEYPSDVSQTLGISILEPNASGALVPIGLDSGVEVDEDLAGSASVRLARHRLVFWPRTASPLVLVTNRRDRSPAVYGKIRLLGGWERLPRPLISARGPQRLMVAYMDRPLFPENFSANEMLDPWSGRSLDDWRTFYEGGTRLADYLHFAGYNALMMSVAADGSAIYPSEIIEPTPRYDTGVFFANAQDPVRKDVLDMLLRIFDREQLRLIPAIEFGSPLPALEAIRRRGGPESEGLEWIGPDGAPWCQSNSPRRGQAPYYNLTDPRVQETMLAAIRELVERYGRHPSLAGLSIRLSAYGYAQMPGPEWGMDDATIGRYQRDTGKRVPGEGAQRFAARAAYLTSDAGRDAWLQWRARQCYGFYRRAQQILASVRPDAPLYLAGTELFAGPDQEAQLRPSLPSRSSLTEALLHAGIDPQHYVEGRGIVLLRPERVIASSRLSAQAAELELGQMPETDQYFGGLPMPGSLFFHPPQETHVASFDQKSPFKPSYAWLVTQAVPSGLQNRRRFARSLATMDAQVLVDGGWLLPLGQEESLQGLIRAYRCLPPVRFTTVSDGRFGTAQPVTVRAATVQGCTYVYAVNDAPFSTTVAMQVQATSSCQLRELTGSRRVEPLRAEQSGMTWTVELEPYDLVAVELSEPGVKIGPVQAARPAAVETVLVQRIQQLGARAASLRNPPPLPALASPGFERPAADGDPVPGWAVSRRDGVKIQLDREQSHGGKHSARITSEGPIACLVSWPFDPPRTGRLSMSVWLRVSDPARQPTLRLAVEGKLVGRDYYRFAAAGKPEAAGQPSNTISSAWRQYIFQVDDLPLEGLSHLRVRFDLMSQGEVWVDDVQLYDLAFSETELRALYKLVTMADATLQQGQIGDCMRLLEGYWPRFLMQNVQAVTPAAPTTVATRPEESKPSGGEQPASSSSAPSWMDRVRGILPQRMR